MRFTPGIIDATVREGRRSEGKFDPGEHPFGDPVAQPPEELVARRALEAPGRPRHGLTEGPAADERAEEVVGRLPHVHPPDLVALAVDDGASGPPRNRWVVVGLVLDGLEIGVD